MSVLDGVIQCWPLSNTCEVWWEAWAVGVAFVAVIATVFLGVMTLGLGKAANTASAAALKIAAQEAEARAQVAHDERQMLLMWITGEITQALEVTKHLLAAMSGPFAKQFFMQNISNRMHFSDDIESIAFPITESRQDRLHVMGHPVAAQLGRAIGLSTLLRRGFRTACNRSPEEVDGAWRNLELVLPLIRADLEHVMVAGFQAAQDLGISDPSVVAKGLAAAKRR